MKNKVVTSVFGIALVLALFASAPAGAQARKTVAGLPTAACTAGNIENHFYIVTDADDLADCTSGAGASVALCICKAGSFIALGGTTVADMAGSYVLITKAGQQSVTASGAGNDVTLVAADDILLTPANDFVVTPTAGSSTLNAVGAGTDVSLVAADDVLLTPADALTAAVGGAAAITTTAGAITLTAGGTTQDVSLVSVDDILLTPTDALTVAAGGAASITTTAGAIGLTAGGTTQDITLTSVDDVILSPTGSLTETAADATLGVTTTYAIDAAGSADEVSVAENSVSIGTGVAFRIVGGTAPPVACAAGTKGTLYYDTDINKFCACNGTAYVLMNDDSTTTGCS